MYIVTITNPNPAIGAKCREARFTDFTDASQQFNKWATWINAHRDVTTSQPFHIFAIGDDGYTLTLSYKAIDVPPPCATCDEVDYDSKN